MSAELSRPLLEQPVVHRAARTHRGLRSAPAHPRGGAVVKVHDDEPDHHARAGQLPCFCTRWDGQVNVSEGTSSLMSVCLAYIERVGAEAPPPSRLEDDKAAFAVLEEHHASPLEALDVATAHHDGRGRHGCRVGARHGDVPQGDPGPSMYSF